MQNDSLFLSTMMQNFLGLKSHTKKMWGQIDSNVIAFQHDI